MDITYHAMTSADYDAAQALWQRSKGVGLNLADVDSRAGIDSFLRQNAGLSMVARHGERLVGTVLCGHDGRRGYLNHLAVSAEYRRQGIARSLLDQCMAALQTEGIVKCNIFVFRDNTTARGFWEHAGWKEREDLITMQLLLPHSHLA
jgi:ribosomal protein S18 acetylase RimI-like enzyme